MSTHTAREEDALAVVDRMKAGWQALDADAILAEFAENGIMQSMMKEPYNGKVEIRSMLDGFLAITTRVHMEVLNRRVDGNVVILERRDHFTCHGIDGVLPAVGIFVIEDRKIKIWREYFDWSTYEKQVWPDNQPTNDVST